MGCGVDLFIDFIARPDARVTADWHLRGQGRLFPKLDRDLGLFSLDLAPLVSPRGFPGLSQPEKGDGRHAGAHFLAQNAISLYKGGSPRISLRVSRKSTGFMGGSTLFVHMR